MVKNNSNIEIVKSLITALKGKKVNVTVNLGRNKLQRFKGVLSGVYPALFTVKPDSIDYRGKTAYSYAEYLCGNVAVEPCEQVNS